MGQPCTGNKPDLIDRALTALHTARETKMSNPNDPKFSAFLQYIAQENGGSLHAGYKKSSPPKSTKSSPSKSVVDRSKVVQQQQTMPLGAKATTATASRPFENVTYTNSPFNVFTSRLYTKVIDGRQGMMLINDLVLNPVTCASLLDHRIKLYMGNPMNIMPFGMSKVIDAFFSDACWITVNGKQIPENLIIPNKKKVWACSPPDITDLLHTKPGIANKIEVRFAAMIPKCMVTFELVKVVSPKKRVEIICEKHRHPKSQVLEEKKRSFLADDDIVATSEAISLRDPILQVKINKPGRSKSCKHTQCFDLDTFFSMNEKSNTFICPICNNRIKWDNIILDEYFEEILKEAADSDDIDTIEIQPDGSWSLPTKETKNDHPVKKENDSLQDHDIMILSSDVDEEEPKSMQTPKEPIHTKNPAGSSVEPPIVASFENPHVSTSFTTASSSAEEITEMMNEEGETAADVIDLTFSSDEEDETIGNNLDLIRIENLVQLGSISPNNIPIQSFETPPQVLEDIQTSENEAPIPLLSNSDPSQTVDDMNTSVNTAKIPIVVNEAAPQALENMQTSEKEPSMPILSNEALSQVLTDKQSSENEVTMPLLSNSDTSHIVGDMNTCDNMAKIPISVNEAAPQVLEDMQTSENEVPIPLPVNESSSHIELEIERDPASTEAMEKALEEALVQLETRELPRPLEENISNANLNQSGMLHPNSGETSVGANDISVKAHSAPPTTIQPEANNFVQSNELDRILSSLPDSVFSQEIVSHKVPFNLKSSRKKNNAPKSSSLNVSIPSSPNESDSNDLDRFLSSIPDDITGGPHFGYELVARGNPLADKIGVDKINMDSSNQALCQTNMVINGNQQLHPMNDSRQFSLQVNVGKDFCSTLDEDKGNSSNLISEDCVLTPSPGVSDDDDTFESFPLAKENIAFPAKQQEAINNENITSNQIQIEKTWTTQDEDALRQIAESIFAEMDAQNRKNKLKRSFPDD